MVTSMIRRIHQWLGLACLAFWLVQALTGTLIVFRWELDDASIPAASVPVDPRALGARIEALQAEGSEVSSMWASGGRVDRFDIFHARGGRDLTTRVDGAGRVLRERGDEKLAQGGAWDTLTRIHQNLLGGDVGRWIVALSGVLLLTNLVLGLKLAWPRRGGARAALLRAPTGPAPARTYSRHRQLGLWLGVPALVSVALGLLLVFHGEVEAALGAEHRPAEPPALSGPPIPPGEAMVVALARYPNARISGVSLPAEDDPTYRIRLNAPGETPRIYGVTAVMIAAADGRVLLDHDGRRSGWRRWIVDTLYPLHTGQALGLPGRLLTLTIGLWLIAMTLLGLRLWQVRRSIRGRAGPRVEPASQAASPGA
jgi:uncharacterized iron-regulated membrane protein